MPESGIPEHKSGVAEGRKIVRGVCPACGSKGLFLGSGGYVTCSWISCPEPDAATKLLEAAND